MIVQWMAHIPFLIFFILSFKSKFIASQLQLYIPEIITLLNCQCNIFEQVYYYNSWFFKKDCSFKKKFGIWLHDLGRSHMKEKNGFLYVLLPIFMFCHSRLRFKNLKDTNSCAISWRITTSSLLICSWHDMILSLIVQ